jgi:pyruvate dehydrogenase E1 component beta subunit
LLISSATQSAWQPASSPAGPHQTARTASVVADEGFEFLDAPLRRVAAARVPLPFADALEQQVIPTTDKVIAAIRALAGY